MSGSDLECDFCEEFAAISRPDGRIVTCFRDEFVLLATLGCFREGYSLYMPLSHARSFAYFDPQELTEVETELEAIREVVSYEYSSPVILAEHGSGVSDSGAKSCDHAHIHVIPTADPQEVFLQYYNKDKDFCTLTTLSDLTQYRDRPYLYLSGVAGQHLVWRNTKPFARQFVRRVCAEVEGLAPMFNWRVHRFPENMHLTAEHLRRRFCAC